MSLDHWACLQRFEKFGTVVVIGGGVGIAIAYPTAVALKNDGNRVLSILGARTRELLILEDELRLASNEMFVMTDDGSYCKCGLGSRAIGCQGNGDS